MLRFSSMRSKRVIFGKVGSAATRSPLIRGHRTSGLSVFKSRAFTSLVLGTGTLCIAVPAVVRPDESDMSQKGSEGSAVTPFKADSRASFASLVRSYAVFTFCSIPVLVDNGPGLISAVQSIPVIKQLSGFVIRHTFFAQFAGGERAIDTIPLLEQLRHQKKGVLLGFSVEVDQEAKETTAQIADPLRAPKANIEEYKRLIDTVADFDASQAALGYSKGKTWVSVKFTGLLPSAETLVRFSTFLTMTRPKLYTSMPFPNSPAPSDFDVLSKSDEPPQPLTKEDIIALRALHDGMRDICNRAKEKGVTLVIDSEHTWYTPAVDAITYALSKEFNRPASSSWFSTKSSFTTTTPSAPSSLPDPSPAAPSPSYTISSPFSYTRFAITAETPFTPSEVVPSSPRMESVSSTPQNPPSPLIYGTYQSYLRRGVPHLRLAIADAKKNGYCLGVKLVRGAYQPLELSEALKNGREVPVWTEKSDSDATYNESAAILIESMKKDKLKGGQPVVGVIFGTHNRGSCDKVIDLLAQLGLAKTLSVDSGGGASSRRIVLNDDVGPRLTFAQLYGMGDELTDYIRDNVQSTSIIAAKALPYGPLKEVIPYLARRAIENKSVLGGNAEGGAGLERNRLGREIRARIKSWVGLD